MENRRFFLKLVLAGMAGLASWAASAQEVSVRMVSADSLVSVMRSVTGSRIYLAHGEQDESFYTVTAPAGGFLNAALAKMQANGYTATEFEGALYLVRGRTLPTSLPTTWFSRQTARSEEATSEEEALTATYLNKVYEIGDERRARSGMATIHGKIRDVANGEPVPGITVADQNGRYATSDIYGDWRMQLPTGRNTLTFSGYPMEETTLEVIIHEDGGLDLNMKEKVTSLQAAAISAEGVSNHRSTSLGLERIQLERIKKIPSAFGESDLIKAVLALPGVQTVGEASSGFNVRGGSVDQNLILFNGGTLFNPNHMFGILSSFNSDVISDAELYKSSIPASLGGRISSVLDIRTREGNAKQITGSLGLGLLTSRLHLEGPIIKDRTTFILGARTTYSDWMLNLLPKDSHYHGGKTSFQDFNAGLTHKVNDNNTLYLNGYYSGDRFSFSSDTTFRYHNLDISAKWHSLLSPKVTLDLTVGMDRYQNAVEADRNWEFGTYRYQAAIRQDFAKLDLRHAVSPEHSLYYGLHLLHDDLMPGRMDPVGEKSMIEPRKLDRKGAWEPALYLGDTWSPGDKFSLDAGVRLNAFLSTQDDGRYAGPEFRLSGKYSFLDNLTVKAGFNTMRQNIHLITNTSTISPMDVWTLSDARIRPQHGYQAAGGLYWTVASSVDLSLEGYWKRHYNGLDYLSGASLVMNPDLPSDLVRTEGKAYGVEFMVRKQLGKLNGWVSYTWSRAFLRETQEDDPYPINQGRWYAAPHDKPHSLKMAANYKFTHRYSLSANVDYSTGRPITVPIGYFSYGGERRLAYSDRNAYRIPDYFRLDLAINVEPGHYLRRLAHLSFTLGVYNVTGRKNVYSVYYTMEEGSPVPKGYMISVFATQIPYINLNLKF